MSGGSSEEKSLPASDKKLSDARKKGQIAHSNEMVTAAVMVVAFGYIMLRSSSLAAYMQDGLTALPQSYDLPFPQAVANVGSRIGADALLALGPLVGLMVAAAVLTNIALNGGIVAAADPIIPKAERINPAEGFKRLFSKKTLTELVKSLIKLAVVGFLMYRLFRDYTQAMIQTPACGLSCVSPVLSGLIGGLLMSMCLVFLVIGGIDVLVQRWLFLRDMRMSKTEEKQERKNSDGNPEIKKEQNKDRRSDGPKMGLRNVTFVLQSGKTVLAMRYDSADAPVPVLLLRTKVVESEAIFAALRSRGVPILWAADIVDQVASKMKVGKSITKDMYQPIISCMRTLKII